MSATAILITALIGVGVVVAAGVSRSPGDAGRPPAQIVGEFDGAAAKRDVSGQAHTTAKVAEPLRPAEPPLSRTRADRANHNRRSTAARSLQPNSE